MGAHYKSGIAEILNKMHVTIVAIRTRGTDEFRICWVFDERSCIFNSSIVIGNRKEMQPLAKIYYFLNCNKTYPNWRWESASNIPVRVSQFYAISDAIEGGCVSRKMQIQAELFSAPLALSAIAISDLCSSRTNYTSVTAWIYRFHDRSTNPYSRCTPRTERVNDHVSILTNLRLVFDSQRTK